MKELIITRSGRELAARLISGESTAEFTRLAASDRDYSEADVSELSELDGVRQDVLIPSVKRVDGSVVELMAAMDNRELSEGYFVRAVGVFARETDGGEVLFAVSVEDGAPFYMPPYSGKTVSSVTYRLSVKVSNSDNIIFDSAPLAYVTVEQLGEALGGKADSMHTHAAADIGVVETPALGLHRMASGSDEPTAESCPLGCWYGQYE